MAMLQKLAFAQLGKHFRSWIHDRLSIPVVLRFTRMNELIEASSFCVTMIDRVYAYGSPKRKAVECIGWIDRFLSIERKVWPLDRSLAIPLILQIYMLDILYQLYLCTNPTSRLGSSISPTITLSPCHATLFFHTDRWSIETYTCKE